MIKCEQIFSSLSTLIKNVFSVQRKPETKEQLPKGHWAEKGRKNTQVSEGWPSMRSGD